MGRGPAHLLGSQVVGQGVGRADAWLSERSVQDDFDKPLFASFGPFQDFVPDILQPGLGCSLGNDASHEGLGLAEIGPGSA